MIYSSYFVISKKKFDHESFILFILFFNRTMKGLFLLFVLVCAAYVHGESVNHSFNYLLNVSIRFVKKQNKKNRK